MMKLLAVALVVLVCISVAVVDGRKNKRGNDRLQHLEKRREFPRNRVKGKPNVVEPSNDAVANKKEDAKAGPVISNDAKAQKAEKPSHEDKRDFKNHHKKREFKHNQAKLDLDQMENFHKRHHGNKFDMHPNDVRMIRKGKMSREMLVDRDLPEAEITKRMMKLMKKRAKHQMRNHSHQKRRDQKRRLKENAP